MAKFTRKQHASRDTRIQRGRQPLSSYEAQLLTEQAQRIAEKDELASTSIRNTWKRVSSGKLDPAMAWRIVRSLHERAVCRYARLVGMDSREKNRILAAANMTLA